MNPPLAAKGSRDHDFLGPLYRGSHARVLGIAINLSIVCGLDDFRPQLCHKTFESERIAAAAKIAPRPDMIVLHTNRDTFGILFQHHEVRASVIGINAFLMLHSAVQLFGPLMSTQSFRHSSAEAARLNPNFWLINLSVLLVAGYSWVRLQSRRPIAVALTLLTFALVI